MVTLDLSVVLWFLGGLLGIIALLAGMLWGAMVKDVRSLMAWRQSTVDPHISTHEYRMLQVEASIERRRVPR